jgi:hypothetical protein
VSDTDRARDSGNDTRDAHIALCIACLAAIVAVPHDWFSHVLQNVYCDPDEDAGMPTYGGYLLTGMMSAGEL